MFMMSPWELTIKKVDNGFEVSWLEEVDNIRIVRREEVIEEREEEFGDLKAMESLLYFVKNHFGMYGSKHDPKRLFIEIKDQNND